MQIPEKQAYGVEHTMDPKDGEDVIYRPSYRPFNAGNLVLEHPTDGCQAYAGREKLSSSKPRIGGHPIKPVPLVCTAEQGEATICLEGIQRGWIQLRDLVCVVLPESQQCVSRFPLLGETVREEDVLLSQEDAFYS